MYRNMALISRQLAVGSRQFVAQLLDSEVCYFDLIFQPRPRHFVARDLHHRARCIGGEDVDAALSEMDGIFASAAAQF